MMLRKAGGNWVDGDQFFDRDAELEALTERVKDGTHTLLTAQRRMGKTSLVRELLRRLKDEGCFETAFVDLEDARTKEDAIAEIASQSCSIQKVWRRIKTQFANHLQNIGDKIDEVGVSEVKVKLRAGINPGDWRQRGDEVFTALAENDLPVVLAIDELPILVNRLLKGDDYFITPERRQAVDEFLSWLRKNGQEHRGQVCLVLLGSVSLEPILQQAGLSAHANIFSPFDLKPWDEETASACLAALAGAYDIELPLTVRQEMCRRLRCQIPHHVQQFFDNLHEYLRRADRRKASLEDVDRVYIAEMLGVRGQMDLEHYESRLRMVLGDKGYPTALDILTEAAVNDGLLHSDAINQYYEYFQAEADPVSIKDILSVLEHDGYLARQGDNYRFVSGLLEAWWRARHDRHFVPIARRQAKTRAKR
ncbi:MAG: ATP-binding protein [Candidatus Latescibacteria bacterium]|nr:ATP-binding protein [Candidatus Latescibacterota bacterium]